MKVLLVAIVVPMALLVSFREPSAVFGLADFENFARFCVDVGAHILPHRP